MATTNTRPRADASGRVFTIHYNLNYLQRNFSGNAETQTVVFLHDFPGSANVWQDVLPAVGAHPALAFDLLGNGNSDHPWPADLSVWGHADALNLALRNLGLRNIVFVGLGLGGGIAQVLATRLAADLTRGLILINSLAFNYSFNPNWPLPDMAKRQDPDAPLHTPLTDVETDLRKTVPLGAAGTLSTSALDAYVKPWLTELGKEVLYLQIRGLVPYYLNAVAADLAHLACPTLIIWGERNQIVPIK